MNHLNHLSGQPGPIDPSTAGDADLSSSPNIARPLPTEGTEQAFFHLDIKRSLQLHWRLARTVALGFVALAMLYVLVQVFVFKSWPTYMAQSIVYVQPTPGKVLPSEGGPQRWPYDTNTYETYIEQQMMNVSRDDVLVSAVHKLDGFQGPGESDQSAALRLVRSLDVTRAGDAYQFTISARARDPQSAAQIANAVTASYIESASRDERTGDTQRLAMLREEKDRIQHALVADRVEQEELNKQLGVASVGNSVPDHYDEDITQIRSELVKARTEHDAAEQRFASLDAGSGPSSSAIDAAADELISSDAGLVSMKTALNARRATLISQMANLTPMNPQYKQDEAELTKINSTLEAMMKELRSKAAGRIQLQLRADLQRTAGLESQLNGQLRQLASAASGATPKLQRSSDLVSDITRLQARYAAVDEQMHNLMLEDSAPAAAYQVTQAVPPLGRTKSGVMRNAVMMAFAGLFFGLLAAVTALKLDPRVYIASDVEQILGFAPLAQLPNFNEVSEGVAEEYMLRLASAIEHGRKQGSLKNCIFTGASSGAGVSTLVRRVSQMLEAIGRPTLLVDATGALPPVPRLGASGNKNEQGLASLQRVGRPTALLQQMVGETETEEESLVLTDTAPLLVSAETEYLARFVDCAIVIIDSGVTTRNELRNAAATLQRLNVRAVGFVLNRVGLTKADPAFRASVEAVEKHLQAHSNNAPRRAERSTSLAPEEPISIPAAPKQTSARSMFEPEVAAAAAAVARFSPRAVAEQSAASTDCLSSPQVPPPSAEAAQRFSLPLSVPMTQTGRAVSTSSAEPPILPSPTKDSSPFAEAARYFASSVAAESARSYSPRPISSSVTGNPLPATAAEPVASPLPTEQTFVASEPVPAQRFESNEPSATPAADLPWWLSDVPRHAEQPHPPLLWQPAKVSTSVRQPADVDPTDGAEDLDKSLQKLQENQLQTSSAAAHSWESVPFLGETPRAETERASEEARNSATQGTQDSRNSRLGSLRNLLFVLGVSEDPGPEESVEQHKGLGSDSDLKTERPTFDQSIRKAPIDPSNMRGASPRLVTAPPEFLPPKPVVIEFEKKDARAGESSTRQDRRAPADGIDILPSKRGQYKKI